MMRLDVIKYERDIAFNFAGFREVKQYHIVELIKGYRSNIAEIDLENRLRIEELVLLLMKISPRRFLFFRKSLFIL